MQAWQVEISKKCSELNMEAISSLTGLTIICPKLPSDSVKEQLMEMIPPSYRSRTYFEENIKPSTMNHFKSILASSIMAGIVSADMKKDHIKLSISGQELDESKGTDWSKVSDLLLKDGFLEEWTVDFNGNRVLSYNRKISNELKKNNFRDNVILKDEITDLHILLNTEMDFDKLVAQL